MKFDDLRLSVQLDAMDSVMDKIDEACYCVTVNELQTFIHGLESQGGFFSVQGNFFSFGDDEKEEITLDDVVEIAKTYMLEDMFSMPMNLVVEIVSECFVKYQDFVIEVEEVYTNSKYISWDLYSINDVWE